MAYPKQPKSWPRCKRNVVSSKNLELARSRNVNPGSRAVRDLQVTHEPSGISGSSGKHQRPSVLERQSECRSHCQ